MTTPKRTVGARPSPRPAPPPASPAGDPFDVLTRLHGAAAAQDDNSPQVRSGQLISLALFSAAGKPCDCSACGYLRNAFSLMLSALEEAQSG